VHLPGLAGEMVGIKLGQRRVLARYFIFEIPYAIAKLESL
jgi:hypothetical protein